MERMWCRVCVLCNLIQGMTWWCHSCLESAWACAWEWSFMAGAWEEGLWEPVLSVDGCSRGSHDHCPQFVWPQGRNLVPRWLVPHPYPHGWPWLNAVCHRTKAKRHRSGKGLIWGEVLGGMGMGKEMRETRMHSIHIWHSQRTNLT